MASRIGVLERKFSLSNVLAYVRNFLVPDAWCHLKYLDSEKVHQKLSHLFRRGSTVAGFQSTVRTALNDAQMIDDKRIGDRRGDDGRVRRWTRETMDA